MLTLQKPTINLHLVQQPTETQIIYKDFYSKKIMDFQGTQHLTALETGVPYAERTSQIRSKQEYYVKLEQVIGKLACKLGKHHWGNIDET